MERVARHRGRRLGLFACAILAHLSLTASCAWALPDGRAYELVSPVAKNGTGVVSDSQRTRSAANGDAVQFLSLGAFADALGTGVATDYVSERIGTPGTQGWSTHAITPLQGSTSYDGVASGFEPYYLGEFSSSLARGVFFAESPLTDDPSTANVPNLYLRSDLLTSGAGQYDLITRCPFCDATRTPLTAPSSPATAATMLPWLAWMSPDGRHIAFQSQSRLTADTPPFLNRFEVYEWDDGTVTLAGRVPRSGASICDDANGPACVGSQYSFAGQGNLNLIDMSTPDVVSDGSDGHTRVFFTFPTTSGLTPDPSSLGGQVYMRVDGTSTVKLNVSERIVADTFAPATFLDASTDGERAFFMTTQALTNDAPVTGKAKIYMYDASLPPSAPNHLTLLNADQEPADGTASAGQGIVGLSQNGHYAYFVTTGQIVSGQSPLGLAPGLYLWHDGAVRYITSPASLGGDFTTGDNIVSTPRQSRVTPDGRWLLYRTRTGSTFQLYLYDASTGGQPVCVSCDPSGALTRNGATDVVRTNSSATKTSWHVNHALADDGMVFFDTAQALVPEDVNGRVDMYEYEPSAGRVFLISTGTSPDDSWFMDASPDGSNVFFTTRQQLVGWDTDHEYDVYDARVDGGFPDPPTSPPPCVGAVCRGSLAVPPLVQSGSSAVFHGVGNAPGELASRVAPCRRGFVRKRVRGRLRCVKRPRPKRPANARRANARRARTRRAGHARVA